MEQQPETPNVPSQANAEAGGNPVQSTETKQSNEAAINASPTNPEHLPVNSEQSNVSQGNQDPASAPVVQPVVPVTTPQVPASTSTDDDDMPPVAEEVDVIEKEWVDKAKKVVSESRSDPYQQEKKVSKVRADYIKKRYGKEVQIIDD